MAAGGIGGKGLRNLSGKHSFLTDDEMIYYMEHHKSSCMNTLEQYTAVIGEVFYKVWGLNWQDVKTAKRNIRLDLSGNSYCLETLLGPDGGLLHPKLKRQYIEIMNISKNNLTDVEVLSTRTENRQFEFANLKILNVSSNMLTDFKMVSNSLTELNLSKNQLDRFPLLDQIPMLQKLLIAHNRLDGSISGLEKNTRLRALDISSNRFSWTPSTYKRTLDSLKTLHIQELTVWPNPFAENFKEYQFITVITLDSLKVMDAWELDADLKQELRTHADQMHASNLDFSVFDIQVEDRKRRNAPAEDDLDEVAVDPSSIPRIGQLLEAMSEALDKPTDLITHVYQFEKFVNIVWRAPFIYRLRVMHAVDDMSGALMEMKEGEQVDACCEFADKAQQLLGRYESIRAVVVQCLVRLLACGCDKLANACARTLAEWIDSCAELLQQNVEEISQMLFQDLRGRILSGMQSLGEDPGQMYSLSFDKGEKDPQKWGKPEDINECASILGALSKFGKQAFFITQESPIRPRVLRPFLPALCRERRSDLGEEKDRTLWQEYKDFDCLADEVAAEAEGDRNHIDQYKDQCIKRDCGGFVVVEPQDGSSDCKVLYKKIKPHSLVGLRRTCKGRTLFVRPTSFHEELRHGKKIDTFMTWQAWSHGLAVLVAATADPDNAQRAVDHYNAHEVLLQHMALGGQDGGFQDAWLRVTAAAEASFTLSLQLVQNLIRARGTAGQTALRLFVDRKLHTSVWGRLRQRLTEYGLKELFLQPLGFFAPILALVETISCMTSKAPVGTPQELIDGVMYDLLAAGPTVFDVLLEVTADNGQGNEPLLFTAGLDAIYTFLYCDVTRDTIILKVLQRLHNTAALLPYLRGPIYNDANNLKYMELWRVCEVNYGVGDMSKKSMVELRELRDQWQKRVPMLKDMHNTVMHRVLLGIVKIIEICTDKAQQDTTGLLRNVTDMLDQAGREEMLIGPVSGLVNCSDFDVKIESLKCVQHVLRASPGQFEFEEMGWLLRYLTSSMLGVGRQNEFLTEVLNLAIQLIQDDASTGNVFRGAHGFAKSAVRESFSMLRANTSREKGSTEAEENSRVQLSLKIVELLANCSRPMSGGLRAYLRRADLLLSVRNILEIEDPSDSKGCSAALLNTWTGRDIQEVLLPLACTWLRVEGRCRYEVLVRLADVIQGKADYCIAQDEFLLAKPTDERNWWHGTRLVKEEISMQDGIERDDHHINQHEFSRAEGVTAVRETIERLFLKDGNEEYYSKAKDIMQLCEKVADAQVLRWYSKIDTEKDDEEHTQVKAATLQVSPRDQPQLALVNPGEECVCGNFLKPDAIFCRRCGRPTKASIQAGLVQEVAIVDMGDTGGVCVCGNVLMPDAVFCRHCGRKVEKSGIDPATKSGLVDMFTFRLKALNEQISILFRHNLNVYNARTGSAIKDLAEAYADYFLTLDKWNEEQKANHPHEYDEIYRDVKFCNKVRYDSKLIRVSLMRDRGIIFEKAKQNQMRKDRILLDAAVATTVLKLLLISKNSEAKHAQQWARTVFERGKSGYSVDQRLRAGIADFVDKGNVVIYDPGLETPSGMQFALKYKVDDDPSRLRSLVKLYFEFTNLANLKQCLESLLHSKRLEIVKVRNTYLQPNGLGRRTIQLLVEVPIEQGKHLCELVFIVATGLSSKFGNIHKMTSTLSSKITEILSNQCDAGSAAAEMEAFLRLQLESRAIKHGDSILIRTTDGACFGAHSDQKVMVRWDDSVQYQVFTIEREKGYGSVKLYDVVHLKSKALDKYVEVSTIGKVWCKQGVCSGRGNESAETRFVVEVAEEDEKSHGHAGGFFSAYSDAHADEQEILLGLQGNDKKKPSQETRFRGRPVYSGSKVRLKVYGVLSAKGSKALTVKSTGDQGAGRDVKTLKTSRYAHFQVLEIWRHGSAHQLVAHNRWEKSHDKVGDDNPIGLEQVQTHIMSAFMSADLPGDVQSMGGVLCNGAAPLSAVMRAQVPRVEAIPQLNAAWRNVDGDSWNRETLESQTVAVYLRMLNAMLEHATTPEIRNQLLAMFIGEANIHSNDVQRQQFLTDVFKLSTAALLIQGKRVVDSEMITAWMPAKLLRSLSTILSMMPSKSEEPNPRRYDTTSKRDREDLRKLLEHQESGVLDRQRLVMLGVIAAFLREVLTPRLGKRLAIMQYQPLNIEEITLLREFADVCRWVMHHFLANEFRSKKKTRHPDAADLAALENAANDHAMAVVAGGVVINGDTNEAKLDRDEPEIDYQKERETFQTFQREARGELFFEMLSPTVLKVLVQGFLSGVHMEASAHQKDPRVDRIGEASRKHVKAVASLVDRCISALAMASFLAEGHDATSYEYQILEAISQAMSDGSMVVSRARVAQLLAERATEKLRKMVHTIIQSPEATQKILPNGKEDDYEIASEIHGQRCLFIGFAFVGTVNWMPNLSRRLVVITTSLFLAIIKIPDNSTENEVDWRTMEVERVLDLDDLEAVILDPKMRQFVGLGWVASLAGAEDFTQILIFESSRRQKAFREVLRIVPQNDLKKLHKNKRKRAVEKPWGSRGPTEVLIHKGFRDAYTQTCIKTGVGSVVSITFVKSDTVFADLEAIALTKESVSIFTMSSIIDAIGQYHSEMPNIENVQQHEVEDSDSDQEELSADLEETAKLDGVPYLEHARSSHKNPFELTKLKGVWFLAEAGHSKTRMEFAPGDKLEVTFFSDGERQRFRQKLACVLTSRDATRKEGDEEGVRGHRWHVLPTHDKSTADEVKKSMKERKQAQVTAQLAMEKHMSSYKK